MDRLTPTRRPDRARQGFQRWHELLFLHWEVPAEVLRPLVDPRLSLDDFHGRCFVGLVPFTMQGVRPFDWFFSFPTATDFGEVNLRTYVHLEGEEPGVCFFSLDAASSLVVAAARGLWHLPYHLAHVESGEKEGRRWWRSRRGAGDATLDVSAEVGEALSPPAPDSLEFFLAERYQFYASDGRSLWRARVHHAPYVLHAADEVKVDTSLLRAAGLPDDGPRTATYFSPGVDVDIYSMELAARG